MSNYNFYNAWDGIVFPFRNFKAATVEVCEWTSYFIPHFTWHAITYPYLYQSKPMLIKGVPGASSRLSSHCNSLENAVEEDHVYDNAFLLQTYYRIFPSSGTIVHRILNFPFRQFVHLRLNTTKNAVNLGFKPLSRSLISFPKSTYLLTLGVT